jgi:Ras-related protein Rab-18
VSNRESFEVLPRWLEELENHVPPEVVKIVVGNRLDKVKSYPLLSSFPPTADARHSLMHAPNPARMEYLFVEASARMAVCVTEVVARIIDTPSLWNEDKPKSSGRTAPASANTTAVSGPRRDTAESMPVLGNIDLSQVQDGDTSAGCLC